MGPMLADADEVREVGKDLRVLGKFVETFCRRRCGEVPREPFRMPAVDLSPTDLSRRKLCADCARVLRHAVTKRLRCPLEVKPACRHCTIHCFRPEMRARIRRVMRVAGPLTAVVAPWQWLKHTLFGRESTS